VPRKEGLVAIILAAGKGKRMKSNLPKVLHEIWGKPMLSYVLDTIKALRVERGIVVVGFGAERIKERFGGDLKYVEQKELLGTGHALQKTYRLLKDYSGDIIVVCGDTPLLKVNTLKELIKYHHKKQAEATILTVNLDNPTGYGRIIRDAKGRIVKIVEEADASPKDRKVKEVNTGTYCFKSRLLFAALKELKPENVQKEYYLTDLVDLLVKKDLLVEGLLASSSDEVRGINTRKELAQVAKVLREEILDKLMLKGITIIDPETTFIDAEVIIGRDTIIYPFTILEGKTKIGQDCVIGPSTYLNKVEVGNRVTIQNSVIRESKVRDGARVGPFSQIRPNSFIGKEVKIGNFAEIKRSRILDKSRVGHFSYIGDTTIGKGVNIGAGTITCNFDGERKHQTKISDYVFVGSDTILVAPVSLGEGAYTAAGSTITKDVPPYALGVGRERQKNILGWAKKNQKLKIKYKKHKRVVNCKL